MISIEFQLRAEIREIEMRWAGFMPGVEPLGADLRLITIEFQLRAEIREIEMRRAGFHTRYWSLRTSMFWLLQESSVFH